MRTGITLLTGAVVFCCVAVAWAQQSESSAADSAPWHVGKVDKRSADRPSKDAEPDDGNPRKYLHIQVDFRGQSEAEKKHKFKVVTAAGDEVGELFGWSDDHSLVIFEGSWSDLTGLYLDSEGHREPLFQPPPKKKPEPEEEPAIVPDEVVESPGENVPVVPKAKKVPKKVVESGQKGYAPGPGKGTSGGPGKSTGPGPGGGGGGGGGLAYSNNNVVGAPVRNPKEPWLVLYLATGEAIDPGIVYQVDDLGATLGVVRLPYAPTGITLHRNNGLVVALPRDGGRIMRINDEGMVSTILEKNKSLLHPVDVAIAGKSDTVYVADNISNVLAEIAVDGRTPKIYRKLNRTKSLEAEMSIAADRDGYVILGIDDAPGVYRFPVPDNSAQVKPLLPFCGGVAADPKSSRWAVAQSPDTILVYQGNDVVKTLQLPAGKSLYLQGRLSFGPENTLCVAVRSSDDPDRKVSFLLYSIETGEMRKLFTWDKEQLNDFVVGPRMIWDRKELKSPVLK